MHGITPQREFILYEPWLSMWLAAKDLSKLNEGEEKERVHTIVGRLFRQLREISSLRDLPSEVKLHHRLVKVVQE